jgi:hypothetical protein
MSVSPVRKEFLPTVGSSAEVFDPCRLARQVKEFGG